MAGRVCAMGLFLSRAVCLKVGLSFAKRAGRYADFLSFAVSRRIAADAGASFVSGWRHKVGTDCAKHVSGFTLGRMVASACGSLAVACFPAYASQSPFLLCSLVPRCERRCQLSLNAPALVFPQSAAHFMRQKMPSPS